MIPNPDSQIQTHLILEVVNLQVNSVFISFLDMPNGVRVNLTYWRGEIVEIHCHQQHGHWVPFSIKQGDRTLDEVMHPNQQLTDDQLKRLMQAANAYKAS